jgi:hypothetical protein
MWEYIAMSAIPLIPYGIFTATMKYWAKRTSKEYEQCSGAGCGCGPTGLSKLNYWAWEKHLVSAEKLLETYQDASG